MHWCADAAPDGRTQQQQQQQGDGWPAGWRSMHRPGARRSNHQGR